MAAPSAIPTGPPTIPSYAPKNADPLPLADAYITLFLSFLSMASGPALSSTAFLTSSIYLWRAAILFSTLKFSYSMIVFTTDLS